MIEAKRYTANNKNEWNTFLETARTKSILFSRNFLEYHSNRFEDYSLLLYDTGKLVAVLPANIKNNIVTSHGGLTFGGFIVQREIYTKKTLLYFTAAIKYLYDNNIKQLEFKQSPVFYTAITQDEIDYAMFLLNATVTRVDIAYAINQSITPVISYQERRIRSIKKAEKNNIKIKEVNTFANFWNDILTPNLQQRFSINPVHSLAEIEKLANDNPNSVRQFEAWQNDVLMAGTTIFETNEVAHAQYISASEEGRKNGAIDLLFHYLITKVYAGKHYFDFGIVNENEGKSVNEGLLDWKEGFGARAYAHRFYSIATDNYVHLEKLFSK